MATQSSINGHFGTVLHSSLYAVTISFAISLVLLNMLIISRRIPYRQLMGVISGAKQHWWLITGGLLGVLFSFSSAWLVPILDTGVVVICSIFGQLAFNTVIDQFGLFGSRQTMVTRSKLIGIALSLIGVILISFN